jgi:drug/metabolite transporter (DMT)-like permease
VIGSISRAPRAQKVGVVAVALAAGLWGTDALLRRPLAHSTQAATIVLGEHVVLVLVLLPVVVAALPALWRAGPRFVAAAVVVGAGSSALATILFTEAFVQGDPVTPVVLQKVQPLIAVSLAAVVLGERPRRRFGLFLLGGLAGTWLMAFPSPFEVSLHGRAPALYALSAAALWALGTVLGRYLALRLPFQQVTAVRFAFGLPAAFVAVLVLGAPLRASWHDEVFIALLALVTGLIAVLLYYYGLQRTTASVASVAELAFPVVAIAVGFLAFDATLTGTQLAGVALTSFVVLLLPARGPALVAERRAHPVVADTAYAGS